MWPKAFVTTPRKCEDKDICTMTSFYYYDQNPSSCCFLNPRWDMRKKKTKRILVFNSNKMTPSCKWSIQALAYQKYPNTPCYLTT